MFRSAFLALCCCTCLISCQQQMQSVVYALETSQGVPEEAPATLSVGYVVFDLQLLPNKGGVQVTSRFHPMSPPSLKEEIPTGTFVLKDNAYGVELQLRALMAQGYKQMDVEQGEEDIQGEVPYIAYDIKGKYIYKSLLRFGAWDAHDTPLHALNYACTEANERELGAKK
ncbi:MAG: hypothetical protein MJ051_05285 [Akkermansia sp.]|nr:hypothetical protein [Akkermansia sp.]